MTGQATVLLVLAAAIAAPAVAGAQAIDPKRSRIEFDLRTRWGPLVQGTFPRYDGRVETLPDGRRRVHLRLSAAAVEVAGSPRYTAVARGPQLFDAARHPWVEFVSDPYSPELARTGGALPGRLTLRGVGRAERFELAAAPCARPGRDCDVLATGLVSRENYGLSGWRWAVADRVRFRLHVRYAD